MILYASAGNQSPWLVKAVPPNDGALAFRIPGQVNPDLRGLFPRNHNLNRVFVVVVVVLIL